MITDKETLDAIIKMNEEKVLSQTVKLFYEKKKVLVCETCKKEFDYQEVGEHALQEQHYSFRLKGTKLLLAVL
jgi:hypothetical protein